MNVAHPPDRILSDYRLGTLDGDTEASIAKHLRACASCQDRVESMAVEEVRARSRGTVVGVAQTRPGAGGSSEALHVPGYEILRRLGAGGMGVVYLARNILMNRLEALKVLNPELLERPQARDRFIQEIQSAAQLEHENIVRAYSAIQPDGGLILAMQFIDGQDLAERVTAKGPLAVHDACFYALNAAQGLQHAHRKGMVHRDIKPANLMLDLKGNKGIVKILDFGLAKGNSERSLDGGLTRQGLLLGSPDYIAPEQIRDARTADIRADIYSLGCTLYFLLSGRPAFDGTSLYDILQAHHSIEAKALDLIRGDVPLELGALVAKMMAKAPEDRFQSPSAVTKALLPFSRKDGRPIVLEVVAPSPRVTNRPATLVESYDFATPTVPPGRSPRTELAPGDALVNLDGSRSLRLGAPSSALRSPEVTVAPAWRHPHVITASGSAAAALVIGIGFFIARGPTQGPGAKQTAERHPAVAEATKRPSPSESPAVGQGGIAYASPSTKPKASPVTSTPRVNEARQAKTVPSATARAKQAEEAVTPVALSDKLPRPDPLVDAAPEPKPAEIPGGRPKPGSDGFVRHDYRRVATSPEDYLGLKVIPDGYLKISTKISFDDKQVPGFAIVLVCDSHDRTLSKEGARSDLGLGIVLDQSLARSFDEFLAKMKIPRTVKADRKVVPAMEIKKVKIKGVDQIVGVVVAMDFLLDQDDLAIASGARKDVYTVIRFGGLAPSDVSAQSGDWYERLDGAKEQVKLKRQFKESQRTAQYNKNRAEANQILQGVMRSGVRAGQQQAAQNDETNRRMMGGK